MSLEAEDLVLELADGPGLVVAERLGGLLHGADHGWRAADEDLDVGSGAGEVFLFSIVLVTCWLISERSGHRRAVESSLP